MYVYLTVTATVIVTVTEVDWIGLVRVPTSSVYRVYFTGWILRVLSRRYAKCRVPSGRGTDRLAAAVLLIPTLPTQ